KQIDFEKVLNILKKISKYSHKINIINLYFEFCKNKLIMFYNTNYNQNKLQLQPKKINEVINIIRKIPKNSETMKMISPKKFLKYYHNLKKNKTLGNFSLNDFVFIKNEPRRTYQIIGINQQGYILKHILSVFGEFQFNSDQLTKKSYEIELIPEDKRYKQIDFISKKGYLIVNSAIAYRDTLYGENLTNIEKLEYLQVEKNGFANLVNLIKESKKISNFGRIPITLCCSSINPKKKPGIAIPEITGGAGFVIIDGIIQYAYGSDAGTQDINQFHRQSNTHHEQLKIPIEAAIKQNEVRPSRPYNELVVIKAKIGGLFYTVSSQDDYGECPEEYKSMMKNICYDFKLDLYIIDDDTRTWKIYRYKDYKKEWERDNERFKVKEAA
ncbi:hypothetical protein HN415_09190, partial [Candidatus Woesearchaeota archaeon]|nr:hypothetical protein [Candidatus Woesearchaeota archaeon]